MSIIPLLGAGHRIRFAGRECSRHEWKRALKSNAFLFKRIEARRTPIIGPQLTDENAITGDALVMETVFFHRNAMPEQVREYKQLKKEDEKAALEYLFAITGATDIWKHDIEVLRWFLHMLEKGEHFLTLEEKDPITALRHDHIVEHLPDIVRRHFPDDCRSLEQNYTDIRELVEGLRKAISHVHSLEELISNRLNKLKRELPFLFE